jgi:hypothetical protein
LEAKRGLLVQEVEAAEGNENGNKIVDPEQEKNTKCCFIFLAWRFLNEIIFCATEVKRSIRGISSPVLGTPCRG